MTMKYPHGVDLEVRHLQLVSAVAEVGSLTRAGDQLHLTQSALSHQLRDIEDRLGAALFHRRGKRLVLTPAGERLLESARDVLERLREAEDAIRHLGRAHRPVLRITTECTTCYHWLPALLTKYRDRCPGVDVRIEVEATPRPFERVLDGTVDVALMMTPVRDRRLAVRPLFRDEVAVIASPLHRLARRRRVTLKELHDETLFIYPPREESLFLQRVLLPAGAIPARVEEVKLTEAIIELVKANFGVSALARWAVQPYLESGVVVALPIPSAGLARRWSAVMSRQLAGADYVTVFTDLLARGAPVAKRRRPSGRRPAIES
jgi:LysR family transcriptional regulator for metE and metH